MHANYRQMILKYLRRYWGRVHLADGLPGMSDSESNSTLDSQNSIIAWQFTLEIFLVYCTFFVIYMTGKAHKTQTNRCFNYI